MLLPHLLELTYVDRAALAGRKCRVEFMQAIHQLPGLHGQRSG